jgi:small subunit ribosomal protein S4
MKLGPKYKIAKRLGAHIFEKTQGQKFANSEARSKKNAKSKKPKMLSDYGKQFLEKQKLRFTYGITEGQLKKYIDSTSSQKDASNNLFSLLERRADNVVYRMGLAKTRRMARQLVSHGHITINGRRITIPSYELSTSDVVGIRNGSKDSVLFTDKDFSGAPGWIQISNKDRTGTIVAHPTYKEGDTDISIPLIFEFYSR